MPLDAVLRGALLVEDEVHLFERDRVAQADDLVEDLPGDAAPFRERRSSG